MITLHDRFATAVILYMIIAAVWGVVSFVRRSGVGGSYRGTLLIGEGMLVFEAILGMALFVTGHRPAESLHFLYGALAPVILPLSLSVARTRPTRQRPLVYGIAALLIVGLVIRAIVTG